MALSVDQFLNLVAGSGLMPAAELLAWLSSIPEGNRPQTAEQFARELVRQQKLTRFQAEQIFAGQGKSLTLGNYLLLDKLGQGGMGVVLKAVHRRMNRIVALKVMSAAGMKSSNAVQRFHREVRAVAKLNHPNIVAAHDADEANGTHFLVMEYVDGTDLAALVKQHGPFPADQAIACLVQVAHGLQYAHDEGVIHRDIKPSNLLLSKGPGARTDDQRDRKGSKQSQSFPRSLQPSAVVKILDLGLARFDEGSAEQTELTTTGSVMGTVDYMAPEQALSAKSADERSDIYSLGMTLWYLLTGRVAYEADSVMARLLAHRDGPIPELTIECSEATDEQTSVSMTLQIASLNKVFRRMVAKRPEDRQQSMSEVIHDLESCLPDVSQIVLPVHAWVAAREYKTSIVPSKPPQTTHSVDSPTVITSDRSIPDNNHLASTDPPRLKRWGLSAAVALMMVGAIAIAMKFWPDGNPRPSSSPERGQPTTPPDQSSQLIVDSPTDDEPDWINILEIKSQQKVFENPGWVKEGEAISTKQQIIGEEVLPPGTLDSEVEATYLLRDSDGLKLTAREQQEQGRQKSLLGVEDTGHELHIYRVTRNDSTPNQLSWEELASCSIPPEYRTDIPRKLAFRVQGDLLTATLNGTLKLTARHTDQTPGLCAINLMKGVLVQQVRCRILSGNVTAIQSKSQQHPGDQKPQPANIPFDAKQARDHQETWARFLGVPVESTNSIGMKFRLIPQGQFLMGSTAEQIATAIKLLDNANLSADAFERSRVLTEQPQHSVTFTRPICLGATEVTVGQFRQFVEATEYRTQAEQFGAGNDSASAAPADVGSAKVFITWRKPTYEVVDDHPVTQVTWFDAVEFCNWLSEREQLSRCYERSDGLNWQLITDANGYRLPTEAEWEFACRAGTITHFSFGDDTRLITDFDWSAEANVISPQPVGGKKANPFGLFDMHGNVREWCYDWYADNAYAPPKPDSAATQINPHGPASGIDRVMRGGRWSHPAVGCRSAFRYDINPFLRNDRGGFRVARSVGSSIQNPATKVVSTAQKSPDRTTAEWVIAQGGLVQSKGNATYISEVAHLPEHDFDLTVVSMDKVTFSGPAADLTPLRSLQQLEFIGLDGANVSLEGLAALSQIPSLQRISLGGPTPLSDKRLSALVGIKTLRKLYFVAASVTPMHCEVIARELPEVTSLDLSQNMLVDDTAVESLSQLTKLEGLKLNGTSITETGISNLKRALRGCTIVSDHPAQ